MNLSELWVIARRYGVVQLSTNSDGTYHACITFSTAKHTELKVRSDWNHLHPEAALEKAIQGAKEIVDDVKRIA